MTPATVDQVRKLEEAMFSAPQKDAHTQHNKSGELYCRTMYLDAGDVFVGAKHKTDHISIMFGDITVTTDEGPIRYTGYHVHEVKAGMKRAGVAHGPTVWSTICKTSKSDLQDIEDELVEDAEKLQTRTLEISTIQPEKLEA